MTGIPPLFDKYRSERSWQGSYWWGEISDSAIMSGYLEAARRLRSSAVDSEDFERVLLPVLFLYRQAIELQLKRGIHAAALVRRRSGEDAPELTHDFVQKKLEQDLGHKLLRLLNYLDLHLAEIGEEPVSNATRKLVDLLNRTDLNGTSFRYGGMLPHAHVSIDFNRLSADLEAVYRDLDGVIGYLVHLSDLTEDG